MTKQHIDKKKNIWLSVFVIIPAVILIRLSKEFADSSTNEIIFSGVFAGLGGLLGLSVYSVVKNKTTTVKVFSITTLFGLCFGIFILTVSLVKPSFQTCDICGYKAIQPNDTECQFCGNSVWEKRKKKNIYSTKQEWVKGEQLFWFHIDSLNEKINFFIPKKEDGFDKDDNWKPTITEQEIRNDYNKNIEGKESKN